MNIVRIRFFFGILALTLGFQTADCAIPPTQTLQVALYRDVPRREQFEAVIQSAWAAAEPGIALKFLDWDSYDGDPGKDVDVFVFDAILLEHLHAGGFLEPLADDDVGNMTDFFPFALEGSRIGGRLYGIPQLICTNFLFYRSGDTALDSARTLSDLARVLGRATYATVHPPTGTGLLAEIAGGTTVCCLYLCDEEALRGHYLPLPIDGSQVDAQGTRNLRDISLIAGAAEASYKDPGMGFERASWFSKGEGRALMGYSESMGTMDAGTQRSLQLELMPLADRREATLFFADLVGINAKREHQDNHDLAVKLARLITSFSVMTDALGTTPDHNSPQYLLPARRSVLKELSENFPLYKKLSDSIASTKPALLRLPPNEKDWVNSLKDPIRSSINTEPSTH